MPFSLLWSLELWSKQCAPCHPHESCLSYIPLFSFALLVSLWKFSHDIAIPHALFLVVFSCLFRSLLVIFLYHNAFCCCYLWFSQFRPLILNLVLLILVTFLECRHLTNYFLSLQIYTKLGILIPSTHEFVHYVF